MSLLAAAGRLVAAPLLLLTLLAALAGCGADPEEERAQAAREYAGRVSAVSTKVGDQLSALSERSDYTDGSAAAESTRGYARAIREAAQQLGQANPPAPARALHRSLVQLYEQTATGLDELADRFASATDAVQLATGAQDLSDAIQRYGTREQQLRDAIQRTLAAGSSSTP